MDLFSRLNIDRGKVDKEIIGIFKGDEDLISVQKIVQTLTNMVQAGGKRLRPLFVILGGMAGPQYGRRKKEVLKVAALTELIHLSSLIHDDIIDRSDTRRGKSSLHQALGMEDALFIGNYVINRVGEILSSDPKEEALPRFYNVIYNMCKGEMLQVSSKFDFNQSIKGYLEKSKRKTSVLISGCFALGAAITETDRGTVDELEKFGEYIGLSFQIVDDILDFTQDEEILGKPSGSDLIEGNITLPVIYSMEDSLVRDELRKINNNTSIEKIKEMIAYIKQSSAIGKSYELSRKYLKEAEDCIKRIKSNDNYKRDLFKVVEYLDKRVF